MQLFLTTFVCPVALESIRVFATGWDKRDEDDQGEPRPAESHESGKTYLIFYLYSSSSHFSVK
jgi:hypothetical protein